MAMQGLLANPNILRPSGKNEKEDIDFAKVCFKYVDELLKQEQL